MNARILNPAVLAALLLACSPLAATAAEIAVRHAQGETVLPATPQRVLTFDLASLDTLDTLGVTVTGVPGSNIPDYLGRYRDGAYARIGTLFEPDYEAVHAAKPDLIIVASRSAPKFPKLAEIAPTIDLTTDSRAFLKSSEDNARTLGRIFGKEAETEALIAALEERVADIRAKAASAGTALVIMTNGGKVTVFGKGSRFGWVYDDLGFVPAAGDLDAAAHGEGVSFEFLLETNPDWMFVIDRDAAVGNAGQSARRTLDNELIAATGAARNDRIVYVDTARWYLTGGGLASLRAIVDDIATAIGASR